ncbi:MAG: hypothetical protein SGCHY_004858 [Lobulomycetales sp.]
MAEKAHAIFCWDTLAAHLNHLPPPQPPPPTTAQPLFPLFVSWKTGPGRLRGCIGTFAPRPVWQGLGEYALISALQDSRFTPVQPDELPALHCHVALLTEFTPADAWDDWTIGEHGIRISFTTPDRRPASATFLPHVALEQQWTHTDTIDALLRKGGWGSHTITQTDREAVTLVRYRSSTADASYNEWKVL